MCTLLKFLSSIIGFLFLITGCSTSTHTYPAPNLPAPLRAPVKAETTPSASELQSGAGASQPPHIRFHPLPSAPPSTTTSAQLDAAKLPNFTKTKPVSINLESLPLPAFINEVFGNLLALSFEIDAQVQRKQQLVTLRVAEPQSPKQLYNLARQVLANYGVAIELQGELHRFVIAARGQKADLPSMIIQGFALPEVPPSHRPIFQFIPLKVVNYTQIKGWITQIYQGQKLEIKEDRFRNALVLIGTPQIVAQAAKAVKLFDQPSMRSQYSIRIDPAVLPAHILSKKLIQILNTHGYSV